MHNRKYNFTFGNTSVNKLGAKQIDTNQRRKHGTHVTVTGVQ